MVNSVVDPMILEKIRTRAAADPQHIILPEGEDIRTVEAAAVCARALAVKETRMRRGMKWEMVEGWNVI